MSFEGKSLIQKLKEFEIQCVTSNFSVFDLQIDVELHQFSNEYQLIQDLDTLIKNISNHDYKKVLQTNSAFFKTFKDVCKDLTLVFYEMNSQIKSNYQYDFQAKNNGDRSYMTQLMLLLVGVSALQEFVKVNMCGPPIPDSTLDEICNSFLPDSIFTDESVLDALGQNGEVILTRIAYPKLLFLSLVMLCTDYDKCLTRKWWLSRCMMIYHKILPDNSSRLYRSISSLIHSQAEMSFLNDKSEPLAALMFNCECAHFFLLYNELNIAERYIMNAQNILGLGVKLSKGCNRSLDKDDRSENGVIIKRNDKRYKSELTFCDNCQLPKCVFDHDYRWWGKKAVLLDHDAKEMVDLLPEEEVVMLLYCDLLMKRGYDRDPCFSEDLSILYSVISNSKIWSLQMKALILRCTRRGYIGDEHINQVHELIYHIDHDITIFSDKLVLFYCASLPMTYNIHKILADVLFCRGYPFDALDIYVEFQLWKGAIKCYKNSDLSIGLKTVHEMLAVKPSPILWCYLGKMMMDVDVKHETEIYRVAWDLSCHTNARAARYLGYHFCKKKSYGASIFYFKESLKLNPLQPNVLLDLGLATMACDDYGPAIEAFNAVLEMDVENCEAWIYLCKAYIKIGDEVNACRCFLETMTFDGKKMLRVRNFFWENYLLISAEIGAFSDVISGFHNILDENFSLKYLSSSHIEVLKSLVHAIKIDAYDIHNNFCSRLKKKALKLFQRLTTLKCHNPVVWELYSVLMSIGADFRNNVHNTEAIIASQQRAIKYYIARKRNNLLNFYEPLLKLLLKCLNLFDIYQMNVKGKPGMKRRKIYFDFHLFLVKAVQNVKSLIPICQKTHDFLFEIDQKFSSINSFYHSQGS